MAGSDDARGDQRPAGATQGGSPDGERLQKVLSRAGVASRRRVESFIQQGRIRVNGDIVDELGTRVDVARDVVTLNGKALQLDIDRRYLLFHKPTKMVTSLVDDKGRSDLSGILDEVGERVYPVGRLDYDSSGLLILTNDGDAANILAHPSFGVEKTYVVSVSGAVSNKTLGELTRGVELEDGVSFADSAQRVGDPRGGKSLLEITLHSGKNRIVRRMCAAVGHEVLTLQRRKFGPFHLGGLRPGQWREFTADERHQLATLVELAKGSRIPPGGTQ
ncbi:pseudouridine synthase [Pontimonas sp.]|jgi:23S rRNA pseudouridine2605 synthase/16S rRNA pseudouridine516 synthase|uniref:pseudouridine synthase n=1 Tax=Pontimonas sp. TaxID=2304492 RepID=UPI0028700A8C|nr:pseudouridine synthase [Pontimonas sp.]MDR9397163.1 pseudouridine synthase [Pontimonas sp.]MDR9434820.1 pseudouridine synthase [Pontimonas sp.]